MIRHCFKCSEYVMKFLCGEVHLLTGHVNSSVMTNPSIKAEMNSNVVMRHELVVVWMCMLVDTTCQECQ